MPSCEVKRAELAIEVKSCKCHNGDTIVGDGNPQRNRGQINFSMYQVWFVNTLIARRGYNKACVAMAARLARLCWVLLQKTESYRAMK